MICCLQAAALCFVNTIVQVAKGPNAKVFHQHEFIEAGFNPEEVEKVRMLTISVKYCHLQFYYDHGVVASWETR